MDFYGLSQSRGILGWGGHENWQISAKFYNSVNGRQPRPQNREILIKVLEAERGG